MRFKDRVARAIAPVAIPNITVYIIAFQAVCMMLVVARPDFMQDLVLDPVRVMQGEWWRVLTFVFIPPSVNLLWAIVEWYLFWLMGTALEVNWGAPRYNLFLVIAFVMSIGAAFLPLAAGLRPGIATDDYIGGSVFLAFAFLYPDFVLYLFFILPIRVKWLALITWIIYGVIFILGSWMAKALIVASVANFLLFFWRDIIDRGKFGKRQMARQVRRVTGRSKAPDTSGGMHRCVVCGATERTHPQLEFRYCAACGNACYCWEHLQTHQHVVRPAE